MMNEINLDLLETVMGGADEGSGGDIGGQRKSDPGAGGTPGSQPMGNDRGYQPGESSATHALDRNGQSVPRGYPGRSF